MVGEAGEDREDTEEEVSLTWLHLGMKRSLITR